jgi:hypothetical protein
MELNESTRFALALRDLERLCCDPFDDSRRRVYWKILAPRCTIEEFESACLSLMTTETTHRVPMPAVFLKQMDHERAKARFEALRQKRMADEEARLRGEREREREVKSPHDEAEDTAAMRACMEHVGTILGANWRTLADAAERAERTRRTRLLDSVTDLPNCE